MANDARGEDEEVQGKDPRQSSLTGPTYPLNDRDSSPCRSRGDPGCGFRVGQHEHLHRDARDARRLRLVDDFQ